MSDYLCKIQVIRVSQGTKRGAGGLVESVHLDVESETLCTWMVVMHRNMSTIIIVPSFDQCDVDGGNNYPRLSLECDTDLRILLKSQLHFLQ